MRRVMSAAGLMCTLVVLYGNEQPSFRAGVEQVTVGVSVRLRDPRVPLGELSASDLRILEDGVAQTITHFVRDRRPVSMVIALDSSTSMAGEAQELAAQAARALFGSLNPEEEVSLVTFAGYPIVPMHWSRVGDTPGIDWPQWVVPGNTAMFDALVASLGLMDEASHQRRVIVLVSDGFENASGRPLRELVTTRRQSETEVYAIRTNPPEVPPGQVRHPVLSPRPAGPRLPGVDYMREVVGDSGGLAFDAPSTDFTNAAVLGVIANLRSQYLVGYQTRRPLDGTYRRIKVEARSRDIQVRHRGGYLAFPARP